MGQRPISAASSPERQPLEHSRLAMPRGRGVTSTQPNSRNPSAGWDSWREEAGLELDGEWLGDAAPPLEPSVEKVEPRAAAACSHHIPVPAVRTDNSKRDSNE